MNEPTNLSKCDEWIFIHIHCTCHIIAAFVTSGTKMFYSESKLKQNA